MPLPFSANGLLDAIDGVAYTVDRAGTILGFSRGPFLPDVRWDRAMAVGTNLFSAIQGDEVRSLWWMLHDAVWSRTRRSIGFDYRCDTPALERHMRMAISLIQDGTVPVAVLYQSVLLNETPRVPVPLFEAGSLAPISPLQAEGRIVTLCSYCQIVAWPAGRAEDASEWIEAVEFYRRDSGAGLTVSHGVCDRCFTRMIGAVRPV